MKEFLGNKWARIGAIVVLLTMVLYLYVTLL